MKKIISTTDKTHEEVLKEFSHLYKNGDKVEVTNNFCKKILTVSK